MTGKRGGPPLAKVAGDAGIEIQGEWPPSVTIPVGNHLTWKHRLIVHNGSDRIARLHPVRSSCGCAKAQLANHSLDPGDQTELELEFTVDQTSKNRWVHILLPYQHGENHYEELKIPIHLKSSADWRLGQDRYFVSGNASGKSTLVLDVHHPIVKTSDLTVECDGVQWSMLRKISVSEVQTDLHLSLELPDASGRHGISFEIVGEGRTPARLEAMCELTVQPVVQWKPARLVIRRDEDVHASLVVADRRLVDSIRLAESFQPSLNPELAVELDSTQRDGVVRWTVRARGEPVSRIRVTKVPFLVRDGGKLHHVDLLVVQLPQRNPGSVVSTGKVVPNELPDSM